MLGFIVGRLYKPTRKGRPRSSSWRAKPRACWRNYKAPAGSPRRAPMPRSSVSSAIYQKQDPLSREREQYQLFDSPQYIYRVFVTDMKRPIDLLVWFYNQRAGAENLIKEANNDAGLAAHPSGRWAANCVHFQLAMLAYNLNCWLLLFQREETAKVAELKHTTLAIARLRFLFLAAKVWRHAGRVGVSYSDQYAERGLFQRLMDRLRTIASGEANLAPVLLTPLRL